MEGTKKAITVKERLIQTSITNHPQSATFASNELNTLSGILSHTEVLTPLKQPLDKLRKAPDMQDNDPTPNSILKKLPSNQSIPLKSIFGRIFKDIDIPWI